jgi:hypothetical protein
VANETFNDTNRTVGVIETTAGPAQGNDGASKDDIENGSIQTEQSQTNQVLPDRTSAQQGGAQ